MKKKFFINLIAITQLSFCTKKNPHEKIEVLPNSVVTLETIIHTKETCILIKEINYRESENRKIFFNSLKKNRTPNTIKKSIIKKKLNNNTSIQINADVIEINTPLNNSYFGFEDSLFCFYN